MSNPTYVYGEVLKDLIHKKIRWPIIFKPNDDEIRTILRTVLGTEDSKINDGDATHIIPLWDNTQRKFIPVTIDALKTALNISVQESIIQAGDLYNKYPVWDVQSQKYVAVSALNFATQLFLCLPINFVFCSPADGIGQNTAMLPCIAGAGIPVNGDFMLDSFSINFGKPTAIYHASIQEQNKNFYTGMELYVECNLDQDGVYLAINRILSNGTIEHVYSGKVCDSQANKAVITLKAFPIRAEQGQELAG
jgi:hypothetical protein